MGFLSSTIFRSPSKNTTTRNQQHDDNHHHLDNNHDIADADDQLLVTSSTQPRQQQPPVDRGEDYGHGGLLVQHDCYYQFHETKGVLVAGSSTTTNTIDDTDPMDTQLSSSARAVVVGQQETQSTRRGREAATPPPSSSSGIWGDWSIADRGGPMNHIEYSKDGSIHVTDEVFNTGSHFVGCILSILGTALLISEASVQGAPWKIVCFSIYGISLIFLFLASTLHHGIRGTDELEHQLRKLDYLAIYPLIAGTFTPLCLVYYHASIIGWVFCSTVWVIAIAGMIATALWFNKIPKWLSMTMYTTLGWVGVCMTYWLYPVLHFFGFVWFLLGGVLYTMGGYVFYMEQPNPCPGQFGFHEIWHVAVLLAATCHWILMYFYVLPS